LWPLYDVTSISRAEAYRRAKAAARRAISLDSTLAEARASLALALMYGDWDWDGAENNFQRAIALDPDYPTARYWYAELLAVTGRFQEAVTQAERGVALAPAAPVAQHLLGFMLMVAGEWERALQQERKAIALAPDFPFPHFYVAWNHLMSGRYDSAEVELIAGTYEAPLARAVVAAYRDPGNMATALGQIAAYLNANPPADPAVGAIPYLLLHERDSTMGWLERAYAERSELLPLIIPDPLLDYLRDDPRLRRLIRRMALDPSMTLPPSRIERARLGRFGTERGDARFRQREPR
jgi:tetratricopeptide (TPR) repeat protein